MRNPASTAKLNRVLVDSTLFLTSFAPLFALLAIRFTTPYLRIACSVLAVSGLLSLWVILRAGATHKTIEVVTPNEFDDRGADVGGYLAAYLMPLLVLPEPPPLDQIAYVLFLFVAGLIYVRSRMLQINPSFYLLNYRVFMITKSLEGYRGYILARGDLEPDVPLSTVRLRANLLLETKVDNH